MQITPTDLPDVLEITPARFGDHRGFFSETWNRKALAEAGLDIDFCQDNHSLSAERHTLRGLHFQAPPSAQDKLIRVVAGTILDVAVDIRRGSPTYAQWVAVPLSADTGNQLFVPKGFLHGFLTLTPDVQVVYKCSDYYAPDTDGSIRWNDPTIAIDWGVNEGDVTLSGKDADAPFLADFDTPFTFEAQS
ncbi:dTDP-4-dehydrorhamnose 3,5-epimerase [Loktanella ponticola]|uniref:dTDP-4-dehydrorhamnose 3,5-epimerase n=1 Tax=Yoonia ponticola TaxID=1524255 RepID=A0A7W9BN90_9RHOB|nr:dTDP-4-dehydrorhamnose 3,5-epimerase [Yoonia ponticola]MBB5723620.1 dTDP-4-dehydrorhamnose 3,5-epimerase [Yoonia ponticola]